MVEIVERRRAERERLIEVARTYVDALSSTTPVLAAAVVGSVARGDFNVWSDIDVVVICRELPERIPDRASALIVAGTPGVHPVGFTEEGFVRAVAKGNRLAAAVATEGVVLLGEDVFLSLTRRAGSRG